MKKVMLSCLTVLSLLAHSQDTLKVMTWNLLDYGNTARDQYMRTVLRHVNPDVLVVQEMTTLTMANNFLNSVLNVVFPGQFAKGDFINGPDTDNEIYYKSSKFTFVNNIPIHTLLRDVNQFTVYSLAASDTFRVFSVHLKASTGYETNRAAEVDSLRKVTDAFPSGKYFIVCGDYNIYRSTEPAYQKLLQLPENGSFVDALNLAGQWNNASYAPYHTQSTRGYVQGPGGGSYGGLNDRFDMILFSKAVSQPGRIQYVPGSMTAIGNDGLHYSAHGSDSLSRLPNNAVPDSVAIALYNASDHLPVTASFIFRGGAVLSPEPTLQASNVGFDNVTSSSMEVLWTNGNGASRIVLARAGSAVSIAPFDGQSYSANTNFVLAQDLGSGNKVVFAGSGNSAVVTGLGSNVTYYFAVFEFNGAGGTENYLTSLPATNSQITLSVSYYSQGNLAPNIVSSWNSDRAGFGSQPADFTSGVPFIIQSGHTMITTAPWSLSGAGNRIQIEGGGTLQADHLISTAAFQIDNGGTYIHNVASASANGSASDVPGSATRTFGVASTVEFKKWANGGTSPVALPPGLVWGNLTINVDTLAGSWQQSGALASVMGNLSILRTGGGIREFRLNANSPATSTLTLLGDLLVSGGTFNITSGVAIETFYLGGSFVQTGGMFTATGAGPHSVIFSGGNPSASFSSSGGTFTSTSINWTIATGKTLLLTSSLAVASGRSITINGMLDCGVSSLTGAGGVTLSAGANLRLGSGDGINSGTALGNIRLSGPRIFDPAANYVLNGALVQVTGNSFPVSVDNLTISNSHGVALTGSVAVNGILALSVGTFSIGGNTLTLYGDIVQTSGALNGGSTSTIEFVGNGASTDLPAVIVENLLVNRANGISLSGPVTVLGALTLINGSISTGDNIITLGPAGTITEPVDSPVEGTVTTTRNVSQSLNNTFGGLGLEVDAAGAAPGSTVVTRRTGIASEWNGNQSILRSLDITPTTNSGLDATLVFHYKVSELNGHAENALRLWKSADSGASWQLAGGTVDTSARTITVTGVSSFSRWTAADSLHFLPGQATSSREMSAGWNIVSIPLEVNDYRKAILYPTATSNAFAFGSSGYVSRDTLIRDPGYWLKFPSAQTVSITGSVPDHDTLTVSAGWNLIGASSSSVPIGAIQQVPPGIVTSAYYGYAAGYLPADSLRPNNGYWVKVNQSGHLILK